MPGLRAALLTVAGYGALALAVTSLCGVLLPPGIQLGMAVTIVALSVDGLRRHGPAVWLDGYLAGRAARPADDERPAPGQAA